MYIFVKGKKDFKPLQKKLRDFINIMVIVGSFQ